jgi:hypothetical protein
MTLNSAMINQLDTIPILEDSAVITPRDTIVKKDTVTKQTLSTTIKTARPTVPPRGMVGIPRPTLPSNENWVFVLLLIIFVVLVLSRSISHLVQVSKNFFQVKERISIFNKTTISDLRTRILMISFPILIFSFYIYFFDFHQTNKYELIPFLSIVCIMTLFFVAKHFSMKIVGYVFIDVKNIKMYMDSYFNIVLFTSILLFPLIILRIYATDIMLYASYYLSIAVIVFALLLNIIKLFQIFSQKNVVIFYILLYLCTLEILPVIGLYNLIKQII